jgi:hypothetical protein
MPPAPKDDKKPKPEPKHGSNKPATDKSGPNQSTGKHSREKGR